MAASIPSGVPARFWHRTDDGRVACELCPRRCTLRDGQRGICTGRLATADGLVATTWGTTSGMAIDPIEKKPLYHFLPGSGILSLGTIGCNLLCRFCQNWGISRAAAGFRSRGRTDPGEIARLAREKGCQSVAFTYNEPIVWAEYALDVAAACHEVGLKTVAVTNGYISDSARGAFFDAMDAANVDLKSFSDDFYRTWCQASLPPVLDTLRHVARSGRTWLEVTTLVIPGLNDSPAEIDALTEFVAQELGSDVPLHFSAFHPDHEMLDRPRTPLATLQRCREQALRKGLSYVYSGNVADPSGSSTACPRCGTVLVQRNGFMVTDNRLRGGCCVTCGHRIAGVLG